MGLDQSLFDGIQHLKDDYRNSLCRTGCRDHCLLITEAEDDIHTFSHELLCKPRETIRLRFSKGTLDNNVLSHDPPAPCHPLPELRFPDKRVLGGFRGGFRKNAHPFRGTGAQCERQARIDDRFRLRCFDARPRPITTHSRHSPLRIARCAAATRARRKPSRSRLGSAQQQCARSCAKLKAPEAERQLRGVRGFGNRNVTSPSTWRVCSRCVARVGRH